MPRSIYSSSCRWHTERSGCAQGKGFGARWFRHLQPAKGVARCVTMDTASPTSDHVYEVVIIGGGPAGLFGLFYACIRQMDALLIDSLPELGGQLAALYPEKDIYDMPGFPKILTKELVRMMVEQATMHRKQ